MIGPTWPSLNSINLTSFSYSVPTVPSVRAISAFGNRSGITYWPGFRKVSSANRLSDDFFPGRNQPTGEDARFTLWRGRPRPRWVPVGSNLKGASWCVRPQNHVLTYHSEEK